MERTRFSLFLMAAVSALAITTARAAEPVADAAAEHSSDSESGKGDPANKKKKTPVTELDTVTSIAARNPEPLAAIPGTVSVIDAETIERNNAQNPRDAIRYEPGVSVGNQPTRSGATNYTIRGIGENRVLLLVDGFDVPDFPATNVGAGTYTRDFVDLETVKRIEIIRGPASALYGSDALGGVVAYVTKDPEDYLDLVGRDWYGSIKGAYASADGSFAETATGAMRAGNVEALALYTRRDGHETDVNGSLSPNPQDWGSNSLLGKLIFHLTGVDTLKLTGEYEHKRNAVDVLTDITSTITSSTGVDTTERKFLSADYAHDEPIGFIDSSDLKLFFTQLDRREHSNQLRNSGATLRVTDLYFTQNIYGGEVQFGTKRVLLGLPMSFTYGVNGEYSQTTRPRYRTETTGGVTTTLISGEQFPNKNFPDTDITKLGFYVQDEIKAGRLSVIPAIRFDYYHLEPKTDALLENSTAGTLDVHPLTETPVSPKLGAIFDLTEEYSIFAQYAHGYRAPPYDNANFAYSNPTYGYEIIPNANLKSETSNGFEAGLRGKYSGGSSFRTAAFYNRYRDFIETEFIGFSGGGLMQFQYQNLSHVTIYGLEARGDWHFLPGWSLLGSAAYAHGEDDETGDPIDSVDPLKLVAGLGYDTENWGAELTLTHAWQHDRVSSSTLFKAPAYTTLDLTAHYEVVPMFTLNAGLFNITDEKYFLSQDVTGLAASSALVDLYAQPGRNVGVNATVRF